MHEIQHSGSITSINILSNLIFLIILNVIIVWPYIGVQILELLSGLCTSISLVVELSFP